MCCSLRIETEKTLELRLGTNNVKVQSREKHSNTRIQSAGHPKFTFQFKATPTKFPISRPKQWQIYMRACGSFHYRLEAFIGIIYLNHHINHVSAFITIFQVDKLYCKGTVALIETCKLTLAQD